MQFPLTFSFDKNYMNGELADKEMHGYQQDIPFYPKSTMNPLLPRLENPTIKRRHTYELYAMIIHHGYSARRGHYYSLIRHGNTGKWIKFDDEKITMIEQTDKLLMLMQKAYILFYEKKWIFEDQPIAPLRKSSRLGSVMNTDSQRALNPETDRDGSTKANLSMATNAQQSGAQPSKKIKINVNVGLGLNMAPPQVKQEPTDK